MSGTLASRRINTCVSRKISTMSRITYNVKFVFPCIQSSFKFWKRSIVQTLIRFVDQKKFVIAIFSRRFSCNLTVALGEKAFPIS